MSNKCGDSYTLVFKLADLVDEFYHHCKSASVLFGQIKDIPCLTCGVVNLVSNFEIEQNWYQKILYFEEKYVSLRQEIEFMSNRKNSNTREFTSEANDLPTDINAYEDVYQIEENLKGDREIEGSAEGHDDQIDDTSIESTKKKVRKKRKTGNLGKRLRKELEADFGKNISIFVANDVDSINFGAGVEIDNDGRFMCKINNCAESFSTKTQLVRHVKKSHGPVSYKCEYPNCNYVTRANNARKAIRNHYKNHLDQVLSCTYPDCTYKHPNPRYIKDHANKVHKRPKTITCTFTDCSFTCRNKSQLTAHYAVHSGEKPFKCSWPGCTMTFKFQSSIVGHIKRIHQQIKDFKCSWPGCTYAFINIHELTEHEKVHTGVKPENRLPCGWPGCDKTFAARENLKMHRRTHTGERPYKCDWPGCEKAFALRGQLRDHRDIHNGIKRHKCKYPNCAYAASSSGNLVKHRKQVHKEIIRNYLR